MKDFLQKNWILIAIVLFAAILRLWKLGSIPPSLNPDEAALGYNAYSILHTGKDEFGTTLPIIFKSFGDYKPGLYVYLTIPSILILGLNEFSTRLPSALFGILAVFLVYLLVQKLFNNKRLSLVAAFVAATNPWLIYFSRGAWEANVSLSLTLAGIYFFLRSFEKNKYLILSAFLFGLTLITYQGAKLSTAIVLILLLLVYWKEFKNAFLPKNISVLILSGILGVIISIPVILSLFQGQTFRLTVYSLFSYPRPKEALQTFLNEGGEKIGDTTYYLFHSESVNFIRAIAGRWFNNFSGQFLFFEGDTQNPIHTAPYQGVLLISDVFLLPLGFFVFFRKKLGRSQLFIFLWLLLAPLPAALSRDTTSAVRALNTAIPLVLFLSFGLNAIIDWCKTRRLFYYLFGFIYMASLVYFLDAYFVHVPAHNSNLWRYGYRQAMEYVIGNGSKFNNVVFEQSFNQPYIYYLYYAPKDPAKYQKQEKLTNSQFVGDVGFESKIDNINFSQIDWEVLKKEPGTLVIASPAGLPPNFLDNSNLIEEIKFLNGRDVAFEIIQMK